MPPHGCRAPGRPQSSWQQRSLFQAEVAARPVAPPLPPCPPPPGSPPACSQPQGSRRAVWEGHAGEGGRSPDRPGVAGAAVAQTLGLGGPGPGSPLHRGQPLPGEPVRLPSALRPSPLVTPPLPVTSLSASAQGRAIRPRQAPGPAGHPGCWRRSRRLWFLNHADRGGQVLVAVPRCSDSPLPPARPRVAGREQQVGQSGSRTPRPPRITPCNRRPPAGGASQPLLLFQDSEKHRIVNIRERRGLQSPGGRRLQRQG